METQPYSDVEQGNVLRRTIEASVLMRGSFSSRVQALLVFFALTGSGANALAQQNPPTPDPGDPQALGADPDDELPPDDLEPVPEPLDVDELLTSILSTALQKMVSAPNQPPSPALMERIEDTKGKIQRIRELSLSAREPLIVQELDRLIKEVGDACKGAPKELVMIWAFLKDFVAIPIEDKDKNVGERSEETERAFRLLFEYLKVKISPEDYAQTRERGYVHIEFPQGTTTGSLVMGIDLKKPGETAATKYFVIGVIPDSNNRKRYFEVDLASHEKLFPQVNMDGE